MKRCPKCNFDYDDHFNYCSKCGEKLVDVECEEHEYIEPEVVAGTYDSVTFIKEQKTLRDEYSKRANNAFYFSIISIFLCCCLITSVLSLVLAITVLFDMNKMSESIKNTQEYRKIRNKAIIAIIISGLLILYSLVSYISQAINPTDFNSILNDVTGK